jgi:hypothetical protein
MRSASAWRTVHLLINRVFFFAFGAPLPDFAHPDLCSRLNTCFALAQIADKLEPIVLSRSAKRFGLLIAVLLAFASIFLLTLTVARLFTFPPSSSAFECPADYLVEGNSSLELAQRCTLCAGDYLVEGSSSLELAQGCIIISGRLTVRAT